MLLHLKKLINPKAPPQRLPSRHLKKQKRRTGELSQMLPRASALEGNDEQSDT